MNALLPRIVNLYDSKTSRAPDPLEMDVRRAALHPTERMVYDELLPQLRKGSEGMCVQTPCTMDEVQGAYQAVVFDHPELFWLNEQGLVGCKVISRTEGMIVEPRQALSASDRDYLWKLMRETIRGIVSSAPANASDYDLARHAYEWVCANVAYDLTAPHGQTVVGALVDRRAVCAGIAEAYCLILRSMGIACGCVSGYDAQGDGHRWNIVCIGGANVFVDCTNGRLGRHLGLYCANKAALTYKYLCFTTQELLRRYSLNKEQAVPLCVSRDYDWFALNSMMLGPVFSVEQLDACLCSAAVNGKRAVEVKFANRAAYRAGLKAVGSGEVFGGRFGKLAVPTTRRGSVTMRYSCDDAMRTILVNW